MQDHIDRGSQVIRTRLNPKEQVISESPTPKNEDGEDLRFDFQEIQNNSQTEINETEQSLNLG